MDQELDADALSLIQEVIQQRRGAAKQRGEFAAADYAAIEGCSNDHATRLLNRAVAAGRLAFRWVQVGSVRLKYYRRA